MLVIAAIIIWWIADGMLLNDRMTFRGYKIVSREGRISEREDCYKLPEYQSIGTLPKISVSDMLIYDSLKYGGYKAGRYAVKETQSDPNQCREHIGRHACSNRDTEKLRPCESSVELGL